MFWILKRLVYQLEDPFGYFDSIRSEGWKPAFVFFACVTLFISIVTPILNYIGIESSDLSSSYQAQIIAYRFVKKNLISEYGTHAYLIETILIFSFAILIMLIMTLMLHVIYRAIGGSGSLLNAFKAICYGTGPCLLGGFFPYVSLFAGFYSMTMQLYVGPMVLYDARQGRSITIFVAFITLVFIKIFVLGTTVDFNMVT